MPMTTMIHVKGAREHNLKNVDVSIPRDRMVVITGVSGSGKSSLAFDTIYAEGQRRYVESLSAYARQFLGRMEKPDVDYIEGLSPAISIDQKGVSHNPRSTVGTVTEVYDHLRLLYARIGHPHCPNCGRPIESQTVSQIVDAVLALPEATRLLLLGPLVRDRKGEHQGVLDEARKGGFVRVRVDGVVRDLSEAISLSKNIRHTVEVVVDRLVIPADRTELAGRVADSVETALKLGSGVMQVVNADTNEEMLFSEHFACVHCGISVGEIAPRTFSFNSPHGACSECTGLGFKLEIDPDLVIPNKDLSIAEGAVMPWNRAGAMTPWYVSILESASQEMGFSTDAPVATLAPEHVDWILYGDRSSGGRHLDVHHRTRRGRVIRFGTSFEGVIPNLERRYKDTESEFLKAEIERYMAKRPCPVCEGKRLKPEALGVTIDDHNIVQATALTIDRALAWVTRLESESGPLSERERMIAVQVLKEIASRLRFLIDVGLEYLTLDRTAGTLSGGEGQRIRLATQIGSGLMGVLYICDEPSVGLHPVDNVRLIETLKGLRDLGNTVLVVEHDEAVMRAADYIVDMGPGAGEHGGWVVAAGSFADIAASEASITGAYLSGRRQIPVPERRRQSQIGRELVIRGARQNNLKDLNVRIPLGLLVCVTGVSGSGKSTLIYEILYKKLAQVLSRAKDLPGDVDRVDGLEHIDKVVNIDQAPIGRTPRSNPATYTGVFTPIREIFATTPDARMRGYQPGRFSFNVKGGRCETCRGDGYQLIEMQFLPDVTVPCEVCKGARYNREALEIRFKGLSISDVLNLTVEEAANFFEAFPRIGGKLRTMADVGLGYMRLGQPATTLSGGEAQRVKLATELSKRATGRTLYILDEPTTGLSFSDAHALMNVLHRLVDGGNTVLLIEHQLDLIKNADWIIDLGPGPGDRGGWVVAEGTPEHVVTVEESLTGRFLRPLLPSQPTPPTAPNPLKRRRTSAGGGGNGRRPRQGHATETNDHPADADEHHEAATPAAGSRRRATPRQPVRQIQ
ncbi:MAG: excinuclease ABC subunit UvrA [Chloroflexi bacterium]|nr:excinuclease ABC subunit UvrA [Chloroflexota bacterium]